MSNPNFFTGYLALGIGSTSFVEMVGAGYARQAITFGPLFGPNTVDLFGTTFAATGAWPTATQYGLFDASSNNLLWWPRFIQPTLAAGQTDTAPQGSHAMTFYDLMAMPPNASLVFAGGIVVAFKANGALVTTGTSVQIAGQQIGKM